MARNAVHDGQRIPAVAPSGGVTSGQIVVYGTMFGVALATVAQGATYELELGGVWDFTKATSDTFAVGAAVYWDATAKKVTSTTTSNTKVGVATVAAAGADATARVRLNDAF